MNKLTRRGLLGTLAGGAGAGGLSACGGNKPETFSAARPKRSGAFLHGVASGDPAATSIIIWTRISLESESSGGAEVLVWELSEYESFATPIFSGEVPASAARDFTAKVLVEDLTPGTTYYYRFFYDDQPSDIGRTKTLPTGETKLARFAVASCANYQHGYFNTYDHIARQDHFDALIHLGDFYYEYGASNEAWAIEAGRQHEPAHEIVTLEDYRLRHGQYRRDTSLQAALAKMPMIAIWDDHETANDSWRTGAENHDEDQGEGKWDDRRQAAMRAYYDWMPIRDPQSGRAQEAIFRSYDFGDLLNLTTLESRLVARDEPLIIDDYFDLLREEGGPEAFNEILYADREMLGEVQTDFIVNTLKESKARGQKWRMLANQVVIGRVTSPDLGPHVSQEAVDGMAQAWPGVRDFIEFSKYALPTYVDSWDGYPVARNRFYDRVREAGITDMVVVTGDSHEFWMNDLTDKDGTKMGVELGTTAVASKTLFDYMGGATEDYALLMTQSNPDVRYYNPMKSGYLDVEFDRSKGTARLITMDTRESVNYAATQTAQFTLRPTKDGSVKFAAPKGLNLKQRALFRGLS